jgi:hypothetical protein
MKKSKKFLAVLSTSAMLASVPAAAVLPVAANVAHAASAGSLSAYTVPTIGQNENHTSLGTILVTVPQGALQAGHTVTMTLPHGFTFGSNVGSSVYSSDSSSNPNNSVYVVSGVTGLNAAVNQIGSNQLQIVVNGAGTQSDDVKLAIKLNDINVNGANNGPVNVSFDAPSTSAFPSGTVTVANVQTSGMVDVAASDTQSGNNTFAFNLNLKEEVAGSLRSDSQSIKVKLPSGYEWTVGNTTADTLSANGYTSSVLYGKVTVGGTVYDATVNPTAILKQIQITKNGDDTLYINVKPGVTINSPLSLKLPLTFDVKDDNQVKNGPINAYVSGTSSVNVSTIQVGTYGDYSAGISASSTPTILAGHFNQQIGDIVIKESVPGTFISGRTIELTLPDTARWEDVFEADAQNSGNDTSATPSINITGTNGLHATASFTGTDHRTLKLTIDHDSTGSTDPGELDIKNVFVATAANATGDLNVTASGSAGVTGTVKVASVVAPATISVSNPTNVKLGQTGQPIGDITITEAQPGAFSRDKVANASSVSMPDYQIAVQLDAPGVQWDATPTVTVSGDGQVDNVYTSGNMLYMTLEAASGSTPMTITLHGGTIKLDNTTPVGPIPVKLKGTAVDYAAYHVADWANNTTTVSKATVANVTTGINGQVSASAKFTIGSTSYTVNGQTLTADVAPYVKNDRTYLPVTYVAQALGVPLQNIIWNGTDRSVTIFKGSTVIRMVIGSNVLTVNGTPLTMDAAPEITNSRTFLPIAWLAQVLGVPYTWDATTQTVSFGN